MRLLALFKVKTLMRLSKVASWQVLLLGEVQNFQMLSGGALLQPQPHLTR